MVLCQKFTNLIPHSIFNNIRNKIAISFGFFVEELVTHFAFVGNFEFLGVYEKVQVRGEWCEAVASSVEVPGSNLNLLELFH